MELVSNAFAAAFLLGALHAFEVDHMIAVSAFVGSDPRLGAAASYGARWGLGHAVVVVALGALLAWSGAQIPDGFAGWGEMAVGAALIVLGIWAFRTAGEFHLHTATEHDGHGHLHSHLGAVGHHHHHHPPVPARRHRHLSTIMGAVHGVAGTAPVVALVPVTLIDDFAAALTYLVLFGVGTVASMTLYASLAALAMRGLGVTTSAIRRLSRVISITTVVVGLWWMAQAGRGLVG